MRLHEIHVSDGSRVEHRRFCKAENQEIAWDTDLPIRPMPEFNATAPSQHGSGERQVIPAWGALSDRIGRRPVYLLTAAGIGLWMFPFFSLIDTGSFGNLVLAVHRCRSRSVIFRRTATDGPSAPIGSPQDTVEAVVRDYIARGAPHRGTHRTRRPEPARDRGQTAGASRLSTVITGRHSGSAGTRPRLGGRAVVGAKPLAFEVIP